MNRRISVTGLGYVGLPVATTFARAGTPVVAFDIDRRRVSELSRGHDRTGEVSAADLGAAGLKFNPVGRLLVDVNVLFKLDSAGLRDKVTPLVGIEYAF